MKTIGEKIKYLRNALGLSQEQLSEIVEVTLKSIYRYENGKSIPDTITLAKMAAFFDVSTDYLLGLSGLKNQKKEEYGKIRQSGKYNQIYKHYLQCRELHEFSEDKTYYWIIIESRGGDLVLSGQTEWYAWADVNKTIEIRRLRPVIPKAAYELCSRVYSKPMIIDNEVDAAVFRIFGGHAIINQEVCETCFSEFLEFYGPNPQLNCEPETPF